MEPKQKQYPVVNGTGDGSRVWCCKQQYRIGTWNVKSMNQGKLEVVKQEMTRVNIDILGISELRWTGRGEFNSDDHYIYYCGQESLRRNGVAIIVNKRVWNAVLGCNLKRHGFGWTPGVGDGQGGLVCCGSWGRKELDTTERLNWTELSEQITLAFSCSTKKMEAVRLFYPQTWARGALLCTCALKSTTLASAAWAPRVRATGMWS